MPKLIKTIGFNLKEGTRGRIFDVNVVHLGLGSLTEGEGLVYQFV
jgi:hypothetical protein